MQIKVSHLRTLEIHPTLRHLQDQFLAADPLSKCAVRGEQQRETFGQRRPLLILSEILCGVLPKCEEVKVIIKSEHE
jgi:hypothetical protein